LLEVPLLKTAAPGEPRSAVGYSLLLLLGALRRLGVLHIDAAEVAEAVDILRSWTPKYGSDFPNDENPAKQLAGELKDHIVVLYGGGLFAGMARRWKSQLNENAKMWAFFETVPELLHNAVEVYGPAQASSREIFVLVLEPGDCGKDLQFRYQVTGRLLQKKKVPHRVFKGVDGPPLAQMLTMLSLGDYVSYYLALLQGLNPATNHTINLGKAMLKRLAYDA
jgi:glucose/mannose-6-phosphate isomerase